MDDPEAIDDLGDVRAVRALAHPLRIELLDLLRFDGPSTATLLARPHPDLRLSTAPGGEMNDLITAPSLVEAVIKRLADSYVFPERSARAAILLRANLGAGVYDRPVGADLCARLSADLFEACAD